MPSRRPRRPNSVRGLRVTRPRPTAEAAHGLERAAGCNATGSTGKGLTALVELADGGANLVLVARDRDRLDAVRSTLVARHPGVRIEVIAADLSRPESGADIERQLRELEIGVEILINNAGAGSHGPFVGQAPQKVAALVWLNCASVADLTSRFLPPMTRTGRGLVINVASTSAFQPVPTMAVYAATKAFVLSFTEALWWELRDSGVRVIALCPGATETEFFAAAGEQFMTRGRSTSQQVVGATLAAGGTRPPRSCPVPRTSSARSGNASCHVASWSALRSARSGRPPR